MCGENEILAEIHRGRADHARACNYDVNTIFAEMHEDLERLRAEGWQVVSPTAVLREEPPKP